MKVEKGCERLTMWHNNFERARTREGGGDFHQGEMYSTVCTAYTDIDKWVMCVCVCVCVL